jgi:hypothetical protein
LVSAPQPQASVVVAACAAAGVKRMPRLSTASAQNRRSDLDLADNLTPDVLPFCDALQEGLLQSFSSPSLPVCLKRHRLAGLFGRRRRPASVVPIAAG